MEVELKLLIDPADAPRISRLRLPAPFSRTPAQKSVLLSRYFDTDDLLLKQHGIALRIRRDGRRWIQTIKGGCDVKAGLHCRAEYESEVAHDQLDFTKIEDPALRKLFDSPALRASLHPVFTTEFQRTRWQIATPEGDQVEMALDQGEVRSGSAHLPISEVELELKAGNPAVLYEVALALQERVHLRLENASKAERGYALCVPPAAPHAVKAPPFTLAPGMRVGEAFQSVAWSCIAHLQENRTGLLRGNDIEFVHQMRVALRRLRSALGLFAMVAPEIRNAELVAEIRWLAGELGAARDWDVFMTELLPSLLGALPDDPVLQEVAADALTICEANRTRARAAVASPRYQCLLLKLGAWLIREPWRAGLTPKALARLDRRIASASAQMLDRRHRQTLRRGRDLDQLSAAERHALRIAAKKLRYAGEFFAALYPGAATRRYLDSLANLQDVLGVLNDHAIARRLLDELCTEASGGALRAQAIGEIMGWSACRAGQELARMGGVWVQFSGRRDFWQK